MHLNPEHNQLTSGHINMKKLHPNNHIPGIGLPVLLLIVICSVYLQGCAAIVVAGAAGSVAIAHDKRTNKEIIKDQRIKNNIIAGISVDKELKKLAHINVITYNATVLLTGEAPSEELRSRAVDIARNNKQVKQVFNAVKIMKPTSYKSRNNDTWITTKVKSQLLGKKEINGLQVKVYTENAHVFLMGMVAREKGDIAAQAASQVKGVKRVVKVFEYVN